MENTIKEGLTNEKTLTVDESNTAERIGSGTLKVFATPAMIALIEGCCAESVEELLDDGITSVGTAISVEHLAASPVGAEITCRSKLLSFDGRKLEFSCEVWDDKELIGKAEHTRFTVKADRFLNKAYDKLK